MMGGRPRDPAFALNALSRPSLISRLSTKRNMVLIGVVVLVLFLWTWGGEASALRGTSPLSVTVKADKFPEKITFAIIADLDQASAVPGRKPSWRSVLKTGYLLKQDRSYELVWGREFNLTSKHGEAGRGMELSELIRFNNKLYTFDDRSGIMFEVKPTDDEYTVIPRHILMEGDGETDKGMKVEWAAVKENKLFVGSFGKEYTRDDGSIVNKNNMWIKVIDTDGGLRSVDWTQRYVAMRQAAGTPFPGYLLHEAAVWSPSWNKWIFTPRRYSKEQYEEIADETRGANLMIVADPAFKTFDMKPIVPLIHERGFSSIKEVPTMDSSRTSAVVALRSVESSREGTQTTFISVLGFDGKPLMTEQEVPGGWKFEGVEILEYS